MQQHATCDDEEQKDELVPQADPDPSMEHERRKSYLLGMMLGSDIQVATFLMITEVKTAQLQHFSCKMSHAVAHIKKYFVLLLLKMLVMS